MSSSKRPASRSPSSSRPAKRHISSPEEGELDDGSGPSAPGPSIPPSAGLPPKPKTKPASPKMKPKVAFPFKKKETAPKNPLNPDLKAFNMLGDSDDRRSRESEKKRPIRNHTGGDHWEPAADRDSSTRPRSRDRHNDHYHSSQRPRSPKGRTPVRYSSTPPSSRRADKHRLPSRSPHNRRKRREYDRRRSRSRSRSWSRDRSRSRSRDRWNDRDRRYNGDHYRPSNGHDRDDRRDGRDDRAWSRRGGDGRRSLDRDDDYRRGPRDDRRDLMSPVPRRGPITPPPRGPVTPPRPAPVSADRAKTPSIPKPPIVHSLPPRPPSSEPPPRPPPDTRLNRPVSYSTVKPPLLPKDRPSPPSIVPLPSQQNTTKPLRRAPEPARPPRKREIIRRSRKQELEAYGRIFHGCGSQTDYEVTTKLGEGTFGEVHKAMEKKNGRAVALKRILMHNEKEGMPVTALREIKILKALNHPCIVNILDMFIVRSTSKEPLSVYMVFPYMDHDLAGLLENERVKLQPSHIKLYMKQLLEGTEYMHRNHILHRDMKAANLLISNKGTLQIADFGLARAFRPIDEKDQRGRERKYTNCVVTRWYRPPELLMGARQYGGEVDLWGIGCVFGEMFFRRPILPGNSDIDQLDKIWSLCGSPNQHTWPHFDMLPGCEGIKRVSSTHSKRIKQTFESIGLEAVDLLERLLTCNPRTRITATQALEHDYFWTDPLPADPKTLPSYEASHEYDKRSQRMHQHEHRQHHRQQPPKGPPPMMPPIHLGQGQPGFPRPPGNYNNHRPPPSNQFSNRPSSNSFPNRGPPGPSGSSQHPPPRPGISRNNNRPPPPNLPASLPARPSTTMAMGNSSRASNRSEDATALSYD
ncbi:Pkinase-domain-containing protein [Mycena floridula]|nr:Pkinase-domain-containing protein [Mycena floridula]